MTGEVSCIKRLSDNEVIAKQIPGADAIAAEAARQKIREKYEIIQNNIDEAADVQQLTEIVNNL